MGYVSKFVLYLVNAFSTNILSVSCKVKRDIQAVSGSEQGVYGLSILFCLPSPASRKGDLQFAKRMELIEAARSVLKIVLLFIFCNIAW